MKEKYPQVLLLYLLLTNCIDGSKHGWRAKEELLCFKWDTPIMFCDLGKFQLIDVL